MAKIFVRERRHVGKGDGRPRLAVVGVEGSDLKFFRTRVRQAELEAIAQAIQAEVVMLPQGSGENYSESGAGGRRRHRRQENQD
jgi:hypothetical protein